MCVRSCVSAVLLSVDGRSKDYVMRISQASFAREGFLNVEEATLIPRQNRSHRVFIGPSLSTREPLPFHNSDFSWLAMYCYASGVIGRKALLEETLLLLIATCALFTSLGRILPGAQSFVLVPSPQQNYYPHTTSTHRRGCKTYGSKTALFDRNSDPRRRQPASRNNNRRTNHNPAIAINKRLVELGMKKHWRELLEAAEVEQASFNNVNYATVMSQLGRIRSFDRSDPRFLAFLKAMATKLEEQGLPWIRAREAATIIHAIGKMQLTNPSINRILEWISKPETAARFVEEGEPQAVANVAWACGKVGFEAPNLFAEIERQSKWLVEEGNPQNVANTAWACATLGNEAPELFAKIEHRSKWLVDEGNPQEVANTAWAFAKLNVEAPELFAEIEHRSKWLVESGTLQAVANTAWACAQLGFEAPKLFAEIEH